MQFDKVYLSKEDLQFCLEAWDKELGKRVDAVHCDVSRMLPDDRIRFEAWISGRTYKKWQDERSPYYKIYPGVIESLLRLDLDKLSQYDIPPFPFGITTLEIEVPETYWDELKFKATLICNVEGHFGVVTKILDGHLTFNLIKHSDLHEALQRQELADVTKNLVRIIYGVLTIGENPDIVKPVVLRADARKYEESGDLKYIEKARRRGVFGFEIGADIPTREQLKRMVEENEIAIAHGRKAPHFRASHLALVHTGKGGALLKFILRRSSVINKDLLTKIPQGYYIKRVEKGEN